jgi:hypothetical protein
MKVSFSQYNMWSRCKLQWKLVYKDKIKIPAASIHLIFGSALHEVMQEYLEIFYSKSEKEANALQYEKLLFEKMEKYFNESKAAGAENFTTSEELYEYYCDGIKIIKWFKNKRSDYFLKKEYRLLGCEIPLEFNLSEGIDFIGYMDVVIEHIPTKKIKIIDFKKSYRGWSDKQKKDPTKRGQLQLYKYFYSKKFGVDIDSIEIEFLILKQKIFEGGDFPAKRIQRVTPPSGKITINKAFNDFQKFVKEISADNDNIFVSSPSKSNCKYCPFADKKDICKYGIL